jgi:exopolysaccharide biosynthesis polyprenyl glycosylphosphotransferase
MAPEHRVLIAGAGELGQRVGSMIQENSWSGLHCVGFLDDDPSKRSDNIVNLGGLESLRRIVLDYRIDDVVIALPQRAYGKVNRIVLDLHDLPVNVRVVPDYFSLTLYRASVDDFGGLPMINLRDPALNDVQRLMKRAFDLIIGGITFLLFLPVFAAVALVIRLDSPGPILFKQKRIGENGRPFTMYKYRSMIEGAEEIQGQFNVESDDGVIIFKKADDPRITKFGKFIRRTSLDEIPQLFNVLKGDMSLVGPRPELPWLVENYKPWQSKRFAVPQGITGWWQINGRSENPLHLHTEDDLYYVQNYSLWLDVYILLKTFLVVLRGKGAF